MDNRHGQIFAKYEVTLEYTGLTIEQVKSLMTFCDDAKEILSDWRKETSSPIIKRDIEECYDEYHEFEDSWNFTIKVESCCYIPENEWNEYNNETIFEDANRLRNLIKEYTGIE